MMMGQSVRVDDTGDGNADDGGYDGGGDDGDCTVG